MYVDNIQNDITMQSVNKWQLDMVNGTITNPAETIMKPGDETIFN
jgi:hypothetical protein